MAVVTNKAMIIRREILSKIAKLMLEDRVEGNIDRVPLELRPKDSSEISRCCIYKDRAMIKYKIMAILGYNIQDEEDELTTLTEYAHKAMEREQISDSPLTVIDQVCSACVRVNYVVTNICRGCVARPCMVNCPKDAIVFENGRADIQQDKCINCGLCQKNCPFHAIVYTPVPCEESCPVGAISKNEKGIEIIDNTKCIYCGKCVVTCPFGAIVEKSHMVEVIKSIRSDKKVIAMVAPAIAGQFRTPLENILGGIKQLGFDEVIEVAKGADVTTKNEAAEYIEKMKEGQPFMTTSCCPSYTAAVYRHIPELKPYISHTKTPMYYTAEIVRKANPDAILVFVGPCVAKRYETYLDPNTDYMLSFEEVGAMFMAKGIDVDKSQAIKIDNTIDPTSRGYAASEGVMGAVKSKLPEGTEIKPFVVDGIYKSTIKELRGFAKTPPGTMVEVMACEGGCVNGCNVIANHKIATRQIKEVVKREF